MVYFKYGSMAFFFLLISLLMKAIIDTNHFSDISIKLISPKF